MVPTDRGIIKSPIDQRERKMTASLKTVDPCTDIILDFIAGGVPGNTSYVEQLCLVAISCCDARPRRLPESDRQLDAGA